MSNIKEGKSISGGVAPAPTIAKPLVVPAGQGGRTNHCAECKKRQEKIETLEEALAGAHRVIASLRDKDSVVKDG
jgi:hypothetical protein